MKILPKDFLYPIEGRHESWFTNEALDYFKQNNHCIVWNVVEGVNNPMPITSNYLYVRLIGDRSIPDNQFGKIRKNKTEMIKNWAQNWQKFQTYHWH